MNEGRTRTGPLRPGLLRPRLGIPVIARAGSTFAIESLEVAREAWCGALEDPRGGRAFPLVVEDELAAEGDGQRLVRRLVRSAAPPGGYDLKVRGATAPRAVWLRAGDPEAPGRLHVAHVTDLHIGRSVRRREGLARLIADVNAGAPDLVLIGGDLVDNGDRAGPFADVRRLLSAVEAPMLVVAGNHDHGFHPRALAGLGPGPGWRNFAETFHPYLHFRLTLGGWVFVCFDSGPSRVSPLVTTRGIDAEALAKVAHDLDDAHARGSRGVVLLSHTPSRARLTGSRPSTIPGVVGRMSRGGRALEALLRGAAKRDQRVVHLTGHTHWIEVFELDADARRFVRWDHRRLDEGPRAIAGRVALVNSQSATHAGFPFKQNSRGHGFTRLFLDERAHVGFHRYDDRHDRASARRRAG
jgi:hypothetical protein